MPTLLKLQPQYTEKQMADAADRLLEHGIPSARAMRRIVKRVREKFGVSGHIRGPVTRLDVPVVDRSKEPGFTPFFPGSLVRSAQIRKEIK